MVVFIIVLLALAVLMVLSMWRIFEKAGQEGWKSIVPFYNVYVMTQIAGKPWWWTLLILIPYIGIIWAIWLTNLMSKSFGKTTGFTVGLLLMPFIFYPMMAFDRTIVYKGPAGDPTRNLQDELNAIGNSI